MKISACYIVKDEADDLRRSLASVAAAADEIVVVSTAGDANGAMISRRRGILHLSRRAAISLFSLMRTNISCTRSRCAPL